MTCGRCRSSFEHRNKALFKTTEFDAYLAVILVAGLIVDNAGDGGLGASYRKQANAALATRPLRASSGKQLHRNDPYRGTVELRFHADR